MKELPVQPDPNSPPPIRDTTLGILVSLYLILLGFFAVLNSISQDRVDKAGAVLDSLKQSFNAAARPATEVIDLLRGGGPTQADRTFAEALKSVFYNAVTLEGSFPAAGQRSFKILIPKNELISAAGEITEIAKKQFEKLDSALGALANGRSVELEIGLGIGDSFSPIRSAEALRDVDELTQLLGGVTHLRGKFGIGYAILDRDFVQINIRLLTAGRPRLTFSSGRGR